MVSTVTVLTFILLFICLIQDFWLWLAILVLIVFSAYWWVLMTRARTHIRHHYNIPGDECDDTMVIGWLTPCAVIQMLRQTHNESTYPYQCCTKTGLLPDAPEII